VSCNQGSVHKHLKAFLFRVVYKWQRLTVECAVVLFLYIANDRYLRILLCFITALHVMQTRYCDENSVCLSVRLSVLPLSVRLSVTRVNCDKTVERSVQIYIPHER